MSQPHRLNVRGRFSRLTPCPAIVGLGAGTKNPVVSLCFQVRCINVHLGASLSLQSHVHQADHWIVVVDKAKENIDGKVTLMIENQSIYVPLESFTKWKIQAKCHSL